MDLFFFFLLLNSLSANYSDSFGFGSRNNFLGGSADITNGGAFASVGNPAGLVNATKAPVDLSIRTNQLLLKDTTLTFRDKPLTGLPTDDYKSSLAGNMSTFSGGANLSLGKRLVLGGSVLIPMDSLAKIYAFSGNESNYLHYMDRQARPEIYTALGFRAFDWLSLGAGFFGSVKADGTLQTGMTLRSAETRILMELKPIFIPYGGLLFEKKIGQGRILLGGLYRAEHEAPTNLQVDMRFAIGPGMLPFNADSNLIAFYDPAKLAFGFGYLIANHGFYFSTENLYWSGYKSNLMKLSGSNLDVLTSGQTSITPVLLKDSWSLRCGYELNNWGKIFNAKISNQLGLEYHQSALPDNPSSLTILDTKRIVLDLGISLGFQGIRDFITTPIHLNFGGKWTDLSEEYFKIKDSTGNLITAKAGGEALSLIAGISFEI